MSLYGVDTRKPQFKKNDNDPKNYGRICPHCSKRYGDSNSLGYIEIMRCGTCPTFKDYSEFYAGAKKCAQWKKKR